MPRKRNTFPWIDRHTNGIIYAHWYDPEKRRTCRETLGTDDENEARRRFANWLAQGSRASRVVGPAGVTVAQALDWYYEQHVKPNVVDKERQSNAIAHLKAFFGAKSLGAVDIATSRAYASARQAGEIGGGLRRRDGRGSPSTIRRELNVLVAAGAHALRWKRIEPSGLPQVELPREARQEEVKWLTKQQIKSALDVASGSLRDFITLAYYTAARRRSIECLTRNQVDLRLGVIDLHVSGTRATKKRRPKVPIFAEIRPTIERLMLADGPFLFGGSANFYRGFVELMDGLGIDAHPHMLRHSRASHMLMDGEDPYKVAKLLGDTLQTVERVYGHFCVEYLETKSTLRVV